MKTPLIYLFLFIPVLIQAQNSAGEIYVKEVRSKIGSPSVEQIDLEKGSERFTAFYFDNKLIALKTIETGELANQVVKEYFLRNDSLVVLNIHKCFTSQEILDIDMYIAGHTDSKGKTDWSGLPSDCMDLNVYCLEKRFTKKITGADVFEQPEEITVMCASEENNVKLMLEMLGSETASH